MDEHHESIRKAAILVAALDPENAQLLLEQLPAHQAESVRSLASSLEQVGLAEQNDVLEEFFLSKSVDPLPEDDGVELDAGLMARIEASESDSDTYSQPPQVVGSPAPFRFLHDADPTSLVPFLKDEHPQTIAVVVSHMPHDRAAQLISALAGETQTEVLTRLANIDEMDPESLREIDQWLQSWMSDFQRNQQRREAGVDTVSAILAQVDARDKQSMLSKLRSKDRTLADRLETTPVAPTPVAVPSVATPSTATTIDSPKPRPISFAAMTMLDKQTLAAVVRKAEPELTLLALAGASPAIIDRFLRLFPAHDAEILRRELTEMGPTRMSDIEAAQQELAHLATELSARSHANRKPTKLSVAA